VASENPSRLSLHAEFVLSSPKVEDCPAWDLPEYAFIGRSNVGKSSLINKLVGKKDLAKTSGRPGKTQLINLFKIDRGTWVLADLPGYGYAKVSKCKRYERGSRAERTADGPQANRLEQSDSRAAGSPAGEIKVGR
jgi:GTP-binding protein EngB required for normal cell division